MKIAPIKTIILTSSGYLQIQPDVNISGNFEFIYRAASGVRWDNASQSLIAAEPDRWEPEMLFKQIISSAMNEYGIKLEITPLTIWLNVQEDLKNSLTKYGSI